ncbi:AMP-binding protein [Listeria booriae]|uniref:AMP-binding protein n=1 Tax=Listeria booriae TaxID=1552123 RepID=UPI0016269FFA|nr:AMP-binding protein [Listeria booriae]MBC1512032.1 amino acid adenylation domain-containing protein [Listeria booriae]MBC6150856.1 amino acid adenylation domain-containing protein [Listeria booriae]MBC6305078.1 amino acid adenylation domain-containing protein [Listeria booriae]
MTQEIYNSLLKIAQQFPNEIAIISEESSITYKCLVEESCKCSKYLIGKGVKKNSKVGVMVSGDIQDIVNIFGTIIAGGVFVPMDIDIPKKMFNQINQECDLITILNLKRDFSQINMQDVFRQNQASKSLEYRDDTSLSYIMYTSGTTGKPKGVKITDRNLNTFWKGMEAFLDISPLETNILAITPLTFDISLIETILSVSKGAKCIMVKYRDKINPYKISRIIKKHHINVVQFTPTYLKYLSHFLRNDFSFLKQVNKIFVGGEVVDKEVIEILMKSTKARIFNCYGPTETTIWATIKEIKNCNCISLGWPLKGYNVRLDYKERENDIGEIVISGQAVSSGYLSELQEVNPNFKKNSEGVWEYYTGDIGRYQENELYYCWRKDRQVKVNGFRVEPGEVEALIKKHFNINECIIIMFSRTNRDILICIYIGEIFLNRAQVTKILSNYVSSNIIPMYFVRVSEIPMTKHNKIDMNRLRELAKREMEVIKNQK